MTSPGRAARSATASPAASWGPRPAVGAVSTVAAPARQAAAAVPSVEPPSATMMVGGVVALLRRALCGEVKRGRRKGREVEEGAPGAER